MLTSLMDTDGVFIGPYDLSLSLGFPAPSPDPHPEVEKVIQSILASAHAKGKKWQVFCHQRSPQMRYADIVQRDVLHVGLAGRTTRQRGLRHGACQPYVFAPMKGVRLLALADPVPRRHYRSTSEPTAPRWRRVLRGTSRSRRERERVSKASATERRSLSDEWFL